MFPIPLTPFEESFLVDDRTGSELDVLARCRFTGRADRARMEAAFRHALLRHPLLNALVRRTRQGRYEWVCDPQGDVVAHLEWTEDHLLEPEFPPCQPINARDGIPTRLIVDVRDDRTDLVLHFHHTRADGAGMFQFLEDLLLHYANSGRPLQQIEFPRLEPDRLLARNHFGLSAIGWLRKLPKLWVGLRGIRQFVSRQPATLVAVSHDVNSPSAPDGRILGCVDLSVAETLAIREAAKRQSVSLNDLLTRDNFLAIHDWRVETGVARGADWMRLMVPINMRRAEDRSIPAANIVSTIYLDRQPAHCESPQELLRSIHEEMTLIKSRELGLIFPLTLRLARLLPGGIARLTSNQQCVATAVFTNTMRPLDHWQLPREGGRLLAGNLVLENLDVYAPLRRNTLLTCAVLTYADRLRICARMDGRYLNLTDRDRFLSLLRKRLMASVDAGGVNGVAAGMGERGEWK